MGVSLGNIPLITREMARWEQTDPLPFQQVKGNYIFHQAAGGHGTLQGPGKENRRGGSGMQLGEVIFSPATLQATTHESKGHPHNRANSG